MKHALMEKTLCLIHMTGSYINGHWEKEIRARDRIARVTQIVTESQWRVHVLRRNLSGGAGLVGVGVKISHCLGVEPDAVVTPLLSPKRVLDLDGIASPPQTLEGRRCKVVRYWLQWAGARARGARHP